MSKDPALETFLAECAELLSSMESVLLRCEQGAADPESINELFRAAHTIKGSAGLFGLDAIVAFTHVVESVLDRARTGKAPITGAAAAILLECADHIAMLVDSIAAGAAADDPALLQSGLLILERLTAETGFAAVAATEKSTSAPTPPSMAAGTGSGPRAASEHWHISVRFSENVLKNGMDPLSFIRYLTTFGAITGMQIVEDGLPAWEHFDAEACYAGFEIGFTTDADQQRIEAAFEFVRDDCTLRVLPPRSVTRTWSRSTTLANSVVAPGWPPSSPPVAIWTPCSPSRARSARYARLS